MLLIVPMLMLPGRTVNTPRPVTRRSAMSAFGSHIVLLTLCRLKIYFSVLGLLGLAVHDRIFQKRIKSLDRFYRLVSLRHSHSCSILFYFSYIRILEIAALMLLRYGFA